MCTYRVAMETMKRRDYATVMPWYKYPSSSDIGDLFSTSGCHGRDVRRLSIRAVFNLMTNYFIASNKVSIDLGGVASLQIRNRMRNAKSK